LISSTFAFAEAFAEASSAKVDVPKRSTKATIEKVFIVEVPERSGAVRFSYAAEAIWPREDQGET
jgi:hypothetical protein